VIKGVKMPESNPTNQQQVPKPDYQNTGKTTIAPEVLLTITRLTALSIPGVSRMSSVPGGVNRLFLRGEEGIRLLVKDNVVSADLYIILENDFNVRDVARNVQAKVSRAISDMVGMQPGYVNIHVDDIDYVEETEKE
jgi:uncharacterized alkaline shock family protein YloU